jgi:hypothetical protein
MVAIADLMEEARRVATLCEDPAGRGAAGVTGSSGQGSARSHAEAGVDCECISLGGTLTRVTIHGSPTQARVPVPHSPSTHRFPPLGVDGVDDVFAKCRRLAHLRTSVFGVYDGYVGRIIGVVPGVFQRCVCGGRGGGGHVWVRRWCW